MRPLYGREVPWDTIAGLNPGHSAPWVAQKGRKAVPVLISTCFDEPGKPKSTPASVTPLVSVFVDFWIAAILTGLYFSDNE